MACEKQIGESGADLDSPDPAVRKKAQQRIYSAVGVLHAEESFLKSMSQDQRVRDNLAQIADVQDIHKDDLQKARQVASGGGPQNTPAQPDQKTGAAPQAPLGGGAVPPAASGGAGGGSGGASGGSAGGSGGTGYDAPPDGGGGAAGGLGGAGGGGAGGAGGAGGPGGTPDNPVVKGHDADDTSPAKANAGASHAQKMGEAMKAGLAQDPGGFAGGPGGGGMNRAGFGATAGGAGAPSAGGGSGQMLASIGSGGAMSMQAAAASGFGATFRSMGLKMGADGSVQHADGSPASAAEVAQLRERLASDPQALLKNPGLFDALSRDKFDRLKGDYKDKPEQREDAFKHVGVTKDDRDFVHTASCDKDLESGCNKHTKSKRYRMGDYVSPEDLKAIDEALHPEDAQNASAASPAAAYDGASREEKPELGGPEPAPSAPSGVVARLGSLLARLRGDSAPAARPAQAGAPGRAALPGASARTAPSAGGIPVTTLALYGFSAAGLVLIGGVWFVATRRRGFMER